MTGPVVCERSVGLAEIAECAVEGEDEGGDEEAAEDVEVLRTGILDATHVLGWWEGEERFAVGVRD